MSSRLLPAQQAGTFDLGGELTIKKRCGQVSPEPRRRCGDLIGSRCGAFVATLRTTRSPTSRSSCGSASSSSSSSRSGQFWAASQNTECHRRSSRRRRAAWFELGRKRSVTGWRERYSSCYGSSRKLAGVAAAAAIYAGAGGCRYERWRRVIRPTPRSTRSVRRETTLASAGARSDRSPTMDMGPGFQPGPDGPAGARSFAQCSPPMRRLARPGARSIYTPRHRKALKVPPRGSSDNLAVAAQRQSVRDRRRVVRG